MKLGNRLQAISDLVKIDSVVADIGTDHGYLVAELIKSKKIKKAIASDINEGPVRNCRTTVEAENLSEHIEVRLGGGFIPYKKNEVHTAIIAGMGGQLIKEIIIESLDVVKTIDSLILQPMSGQEIIREYLVNNNFEIVKEVIKNEQDRFYEIMVVKYGYAENQLDKDLESKITFDYKDELFLEIGYKVDIANSNYIGFLDRKIQKYEMIVNQIKNNSNSTDSSINRMNIASDKLNKINEVKSCILIQEK